MGKYADLFAEYLKKECGYPESSIITNTYRYERKVFDRVEVLDGEMIIQAFVLMSETQCEESEKFPFYRTYYFQRNDYGYVIPPACNVAVYDEKTKHWDIHSSTDLRLELTSPDFLNYDCAVQRFKKRMYYPGSLKMWKKIRARALFSLIIMVLYITAHVLSLNGSLNGWDIPLNASVAGFFIVMIVLLLLPPLMPYIKSIAIKGNGIEFYEAMQNRK